MAIKRKLLYIYLICHTLPYFINGIIVNWLSPVKLPLEQFCNFIYRYFYFDQLSWLSFFLNIREQRTDRGYIYQNKTNVFLSNKNIIRAGHIKLEGLGVS